MFFRENSNFYNFYFIFGAKIIHFYQAWKIEFWPKKTNKKLFHTRIMKMKANAIMETYKSFFMVEMWVTGFHEIWLPIYTFLHHWYERRRLTWRVRTYCGARVLWKESAAYFWLKYAFGFIFSNIRYTS